FIAVDLASEDAPLAILRYLWQNRLRVRTLVNNAGVADQSFLARQPRRSIRRTINTNVMAPAMLTRLFLPRMLRHGGAIIITVASTAPFRPSPQPAVYAGSKSFMQNFTESLSQELEGSNVYVTLVCPGVTRTPLLRASGMRESDIPATAMNPEQVAAE